MIRISNLKYPIEKAEKKLDLEKLEKELKIKISKMLKIGVEDIQEFRLHKKSIDAREKLGGYYVLAVDISIKNEDKYVNNKHYKHVTKVKEYNYEIPQKTCDTRPVIIGFGPAGMMAGLVLARAGLRPIIIEQGKDVKRREQDIKEFWENGKLCTSSNVQFGEGGAGTFSDGKLNTNINDPRSQFLMQEFVKASAPEDILYEAKPHVGTDNLRQMVQNIRKEILKYGSAIYFEHKVIDILHDDNNNITGAVVKNLTNTTGFTLKTSNIILAIGHSARDTFDMLQKIQQPMEQKPFAIGVRIEHKQKLINDKQYDRYARYLPPADYKLNVRCNFNKRGAYTFCMCPGGYVINASSEENRLVTNGMSYYDRDAENANSALLVEIYPSDFEDPNNPLSGIKFQRELEEKAFIAGGSNYSAPVQRVGDFLEGVSSINSNLTLNPKITPTFKPSFTPANFKDIVPEFVYETLKFAILEMNKKIKGFSNEDAILTGLETRSSSPVRVLRGDNFESTKFNGLYPCGEGCGHAGGIVSAGIDGMKCAEAILDKL